MLYRRITYILCIELALYPRLYPLLHTFVYGSYFILYTKPQTHTKFLVIHHLFDVYIYICVCCLCVALLYVSVVVSFVCVAVGYVTENWYFIFGIIFIVYTHRAKGNLVPIPEPGSGTVKNVGSS